MLSQNSLKYISLTSNKKAKLDFFCSHKTSIYMMILFRFAIWKVDLGLKL